MTERTAATLLDRGRAEHAEREAEQESHRRGGYESALREIRRSLVCNFYEDTLVAQVGGYGSRERVYGPDSPDPEIRLLDTRYEDLGWMGGQYRYVDYTFDLDGFTWRVDWNYHRSFGWEMRFFVKVPLRKRLPRFWESRSKWVQVYSPASLVEVAA